MHSKAPKPPSLELPLYQPPAAMHDPSLSQQLGWVAGILFLAAALALFLLGQSPAWSGLIGNLSINFLAMVVEALPFMLIGSLAGGLIEVFVPVHLVERVFGRHHLRSIFLAGGMGLAFPVCECAIVPVVRRLLGKGVPLGAAITFLLSGPIVNVVVAASTAIAYSYNWQMVALRLSSGYVIAVVLGLVLGWFWQRGQALLPDMDKRPLASCGHEHCASGIERHTSLWQRFRHALEHALDDFFAIAFYLVIGAFIAAFVRSTFSMDFFAGLSASPWQAVLLMMAMALMLNLCSEADAFIAAGFRGLLPVSAQLAFMVLGPMLDIKLLLMYMGLFRAKFIVVLAGSIFVTVFAAMLALHFLIPVSL